MATYAISDLHGAFDEFHKMLDLINFQYDGSDTLYLLGDYADWGKRSMETLLYVKDLSERYPFVHCLMGNHERMFLETIESGYDNVTLNEVAENWTIRNHGDGTWRAFMAMTEEEQKSLVLWMQSLPYSADAVVRGRRYMLAHAYPYHYDMHYEGHMRTAHEQTAVWRRLLIRENPFANYDGDKEYYKLICGHTITNVYYRELRQESDWRGDKPVEGVRNRVFYGERFIDIDCGAKCLDLDPDENEIFKVASLRAQLACLRLDDEQDYYIHRNVVEIPDISRSIDALTESLTAAIPTDLSEIRIPEMRVPELHIPQIHMPEIRVPDIKMPEIKVPDMRLSEYGIPIFKSLEDEKRWAMSAYDKWFNSVMSRTEQRDASDADDN